MTPPIYPSTTHHHHTASTMLKRLLRRRRPRLLLRKGGRSSSGEGQEPQQQEEAATPPEPAATTASSHKSKNRDQYVDEVAEDATALAPLLPAGQSPVKKKQQPSGDDIAEASPLPVPSPHAAATAAAAAAAAAAPAAALETSSGVIPGKEAAVEEDEEEDEEGGSRYAKIVLGVYLSLLLLGFGMSLLSDVARLMPRLLQLSLALQVGATAFFALTVPLTHLSGGLFFRKQWRFFQPFQGGVRCVSE
jgi:hypothetical protein